MAEQEELIALSNLHIEPNNCPLEEPISLAMDFELSEQAGCLRDSFWEVKFIADQANKRKIVGARFASRALQIAPRNTHGKNAHCLCVLPSSPVLGQTPPQDLVPGPQQMSFSVCAARRLSVAHRTRLVELPWPRPRVRLVLTRAPMTSHAGGRGRCVAFEAARSGQRGLADGDALLRWRTARDRAGLHGDAGDAGAGWDAHSFSVQPTRLSAPMSQPVPAAGESLPGALPRCVGASAAHRAVWSGPLDVPRKRQPARVRSCRTRNGRDASRWQGCDLMHPLPRRRT
jgi:hypothetical protein